MSFHSEAKSIRKRNSALFFLLIESELFFTNLLIEKKLKIVFFYILQKTTVLEMKNPELSFYSLSFQLCFDMRVIFVA